MRFDVVHNRDHCSTHIRGNEMSTIIMWRIREEMSNRRVFKKDSAAISYLKAFSLIFGDIFDLRYSN